VKCTAKDQNGANFALNAYCLSVIRVRSLRYLQCELRKKIIFIIIISSSSSSSSNSSSSSSVQCQQMQFFFRYRLCAPPSLLLRVVPKAFLQRLKRPGLEAEYSSVSISEAKK
jgi:hypothetical protein